MKLSLISTILSNIVLFSRDDVFGKYFEWFKQSDSGIWGILKQLGFELARIMGKVIDALFSVFTDLYKLITFTNETETINFIAQYRPLMLGIGGLAVLVCALMMMFGSEEIKASKMFQNIFVGILIILMLPNVLNWLNLALINYAKTEIGLMEQQTGHTMLDYTIDLKYVFADNSYSLKDGDSNQRPNQLNDSSVWNINPSETIIGRDFSGYDDIFQYQYNAEDGTTTKIEEFKVAGVKVDLLTPWYYRYKFKFFPVYVYYLGEILMLTLTIGKAIKLIIEIMIGNLVTNLLAVTDVGKGERLKQAIRHLINAYITLAYVFTAVVIYRMFMNFIINSNMTDLGKIIITAFGTLAFMDGPNIIERIFGYDAGLKSVFHTFMAAAHVAKGVKDTVQGIPGKVDNIGKGIKNAGQIAGKIAQIPGNMGKTAEKIGEGVQNIGRHGNKENSGGAGGTNDGHIRPGTSNTGGNNENGGGSDGTNSGNTGSGTGGTGGSGNGTNQPGNSGGNGTQGGGRRKGWSPFRTQRGNLRGNEGSTRNAQPPRNTGTGGGTGSREGTSNPVQTGPGLAPGGNESSSRGVPGDQGNGTRHNSAPSEPPRFEPNNTGNNESPSANPSGVQAENANGDPVAPPLPGRQNQQRNNDSGDQGQGESEPNTAVPPLGNQANPPAGQTGPNDEPQISSGPKQTNEPPMPAHAERPAPQGPQISKNNPQAAPPVSMQNEMNKQNTGNIAQGKNPPDQIGKSNPFEPSEENKPPRFNNGKR